MHSESGNDDGDDDEPARKVGYKLFMGVDHGGRWTNHPRNLE